MRLLRQVQTALVWLTRIPAGGFGDSYTKLPELKDSFWAFPLIGALIGQIVAWVIIGLYHFSIVPAIPALILGLVIGFLITGALHEDGLADTLDGTAAGQDRTRRLAIMRDSSVGVYGVSALILTLLLKLFLMEYALFQLQHYFIEILTMSFAMARGAMPFLIKFAPAIDGSSSASMGQVSWIQLGGIALILVTGLFWAFPPITALLAIIGQAGLILLVGLWTKWRLGGVTGDICGALALLTEIFMLGLFIRFLL